MFWVKHRPSKAVNRKVGSLPIAKPLDNVYSELELNVPASYSIMKENDSSQRNSIRFLIKERERRRRNTGRA